MSRHAHHIGRPRKGYRGGRPTKQMGVNHLGEDLRPVVRAFVVPPTHCDHCHAAIVTYQPGDMEVRCLTCGWAHLMAPPRTPQGPAWR